MQIAIEPAKPFAYGTLDGVPVRAARQPGQLLVSFESLAAGPAADDGPPAPRAAQASSPSPTTASAATRTARCTSCASAVSSPTTAGTTSGRSGRRAVTSWRRRAGRRPRRRARRRWHPRRRRRRRAPAGRLTHRAGPTAFHRSAEPRPSVGGHLSWLRRSDTVRRSDGKNGASGGATRAVSCPMPPWTSSTPSAASFGTCASR